MCLMSYNSVQYFLYVSMSLHQAFIEPLIDALRNIFSINQTSLSVKAIIVDTQICHIYQVSIYHWLRSNGVQLKPQFNASIIIQRHNCLSVEVLLNFGLTVASDPHPLKQMITVGTCDYSKIKSRVYSQCWLNIEAIRDRTKGKESMI